MRISTALTSTLVTLISTVSSVALPADQLSLPGIHRPDETPCDASDDDGWRLGYKAMMNETALLGDITGCGPRMNVCMPFFKDLTLPDNVPDGKDNHRIIQVDLSRLRTGNHSTNNATTIEAILFDNHVCKRGPHPIQVSEGETTDIYGLGRDFKSFLVRNRSRQSGA